MSEHTRAVVTIAIFIAIAVAMELLRPRGSARADTGPPEIQAPMHRLDPPRSRG